MARAHFRDTIQDQNGNVIAGATVQVYEEGTTTPIAQSMYAADSGGSPLTNPLTTDALGVADFYLPVPQDVDLLISKTGYTTQTISRVRVGIGELSSNISSSHPGDTTSTGNDPNPASGNHRHATYPWTQDNPPLGRVSVGVDGIPGGLNEYARADHTHGAFAGIPVASAVGNASSIGVSGAFAASDHRHAREGFGAPSASAPGDAQATGVATTVPHSDHVHAREVETLLGLFGDGSDGDVTISVNTSLARDMFYNSLTVNAGITLTPNNFRIYVKTTLTLAAGAVISANGNNAAGAVAGASQGSGTLVGGTAGGAGQIGAGSNGSSNPTTGMGGSGGAGGKGNAGATNGGTGGTSNRSASFSPPRGLLSALVPIGSASSGAGMGGGGGGGDGAATAGGGGGGGGGEVWICARTISNVAGTISANGGTGGAGTTDPPATLGAGGGGGGGLILTICRTYTGIAPVANGGAKGTPNPGTTEANGSTGTVVQLTV